MAIELKLRQGSTSDHTSFTGAQGEVTVEFPVDSNGDPDAGSTSSKPWKLRVHDGSVAGGHIITTRDGTDTFSNKTMASPVITGDVNDSGGNTIMNFPANGTVSINTLKINNPAGTLTPILEEIRTRSIKMSLAIGGGDF